MGWLRKEKERNIPKPLRVLVEQSHRWAGVIAGPPGTGKTTFMLTLAKMTSSLYVGVKDTSQQFLEVPEEVVRDKLSSVLHFTAIGIRPAFDALTSQYIEHLEDIENILGRFKPDIAEWIMVRIRVLKSWIIEREGKRYIRVPLALQSYDELARRLVIGILYASRSTIPHVILLDDALAFVTDTQYREAFSAMMRPYIVSVNRYLDARELLMYNPVIITPGGSGVCAAA